MSYKVMPTVDQPGSNDLNLPSGFSFAATACGIKPSGKLDLSIIVSDQPVTAAGVYTTNQVVAAPVVWCRKITPGDNIRAVVTNSGNANACTGSQGEQNTQAMASAVAKHLDCHPDQVLVMSTGIIGQQLPMVNLHRGIEQAVSSIQRSDQSFLAAADGILTTDQGRKVATATVQVGSTQYQIAAMAKGAGMIAPNMATMLAVVLTDAPLDPKTSQNVLKAAAAKSFNRVSVDQHMSTNDTLLLLSSGAGQTLAGDDLAAFQAAVDQVCIDLAKLLVADGEGATHVMAITVSGARCDQDAENVARTIGESPLVKTAIAGGDPNWGRIVSAAGYAKAKIDPDQIGLSIGGVTIYAKGSPVDFDAAVLSQQIHDAAEVPIELTVGDGTGRATCWASDLTVDYVRFNSEYTT